MNCFPRLRVPGTRRLAGVSRARLCLLLLLLVFSLAIVNIVLMHFWALCCPSAEAPAFWTRVSVWVAGVWPGGGDGDGEMQAFCTPQPPVARYPPSESDTDTEQFAGLEWTASRSRRTRPEQKNSQKRSRGQSLIPRRFHHMFKDDRLPSPYAMSLRALVRLHSLRDARSSNCSYTYTSSSANASIEANAPSASTAPTAAVTEAESNDAFDYHFWSDSALHQLKRDRLASADPLYRALAMTRSTIELTDMARYLVMYELGGVYADLDVEFVRPVDGLLQRGYPCILSAENPIQVRTHIL